MMKTRSQIDNTLIEDFRLIKNIRNSIAAREGEGDRKREGEGDRKRGRERGDRGREKERVHRL